MSGVADSGMDVLIEISHLYFERVIRNIYAKQAICFPGVHEIPFPGRDPVTVRDLVPALREVSLVEEDGSVKIRLVLGAYYGQFPFGNGWEDILDEAEFPPLFIGLIAAEDGNGLALDVSQLPLPAEVLEGLSALRFSIPIDFLSQSVELPRTDAPEAGPEPVQLLNVSLFGWPAVRVLHGNLLIGLDLDWSQDEQELRDHGFVGVEHITRDFPGGTPRLCGLPEQTDVDFVAFRNFDISFLTDLTEQDWAIALDDSVLDGILHGIPSLRLNRPGTPSDCGPEGATRFMCVGVGSFAAEAGVVRVLGSGYVFACPEEWYAPNDWYMIEFRADVALSAAFAGLTASYQLTEAIVEGNDVLETIQEQQPDLFQGELDLPLNASFGSPDDALGELRVNEVIVQTNGLVFRGTGSVQVHDPVVHCPARLLFATACGESEAPLQASFTISVEGAPVHLCPLVFRGRDAESFSVAAPAELQPDGHGLPLEPGSSQSVQINLSGTPGVNYSAELDVPSSAPCTVELIGDLRQPETGLNPASLDLTQTDAIGLCTADFPRTTSITKSTVLTNSGPGNLRVCSVRISENAQNPDGVDVFTIAEELAETVLGINEEVRIRVRFRPRESGTGRTFDGAASVETNAGSLRIALTGRLDRTTDWDSDGIIGSFASRLPDPYGFFCGKADWDYFRQFGGRIFDPSVLNEFLGILGGSDCCPPPLGPVCLCLDFLDLDFEGVPRGLGLEVVDEKVQVLAANQSASASRRFLFPVKEGRTYAIRAAIPPASVSLGTSPLGMRRWFVRQEGFHKSGQTLRDLSVAGDYAYAVGAAGVDVIHLADLEKPAPAGQISQLIGSGSVASWGGRLLVGGNGVLVYTLANPRRPKLVGKLALSPAVRTLVAFPSPGRELPVAYAFTSRLHVLDFSDPERPFEMVSLETRVMANRAIQRDGTLYVFGANGLEIFDVAQPGQPVALGFLPLRREATNGALMGSFALPIYDGRTVDLVDCSDPRRPQAAGGWLIEDWMEPYLPLRGPFVRYRDRLLVLSGGNPGIRVMRVRRHVLNQEKLHQLKGKKEIGQMSHST